MMLRALATIVIVALFLLNWMLPSTEIGRRGPDESTRTDVEVTAVRVGEPMPDATLADLNGAPVELSELRGQRVLIVFERSIDWCPFTKARLLGLSQTFEEVPDLAIVWVMAAEQCSERTRRLIGEYGLRERILFLADEQSALIRELGLLKPEPDMMEEGVPHPTTVLVDREGVVRFIDVREDYHYWLDPGVLVAALDSLP